MEVAINACIYIIDHATIYPHIKMLVYYQGKGLFLGLFKDALQYDHEW
jgi:hypothetical protein